MKASKKQWWRVCLTSVVVAFALACSCMIAGCGGGSGAVESRERVPEANVDPSRIDSGSYLADNGFGYSADVWYIDATRRAPASILKRGRSFCLCSSTRAVSPSIPTAMPR